MKMILRLYDLKDPNTLAEELHTLFPGSRPEGTNHDNWVDMVVPSPWWTTQSIQRLEDLCRAGYLGRFEHINPNFPGASNVQERIWLLDGYYIPVDQDEQPYTFDNAGPFGAGDRKIYKTLHLNDAQDILHVKRLDDRKVLFSTLASHFGWNKETTMAVKQLLLAAKEIAPYSSFNNWYENRGDQQHYLSEYLRFKQMTLDSQNLDDYVGYQRAPFLACDID